MEFSVNHPIIFVIVGLILLCVIGQSVIFMVRAIKRSKELGIETETIKKTISGAVVFTIAPSIAIVLGVLTLSKSLGIPFPWFRLSVVGSLTYEVSAFGLAAQPLGLATGTMITDASDFVTIAFVMTSGIISGPLIAPLITKRVTNGLLKVEQKDKKWAELLNTAMFMGLISAFLGVIFCDMSDLFSAEVTNKTKCLIAPCVMLISSVTIAVFAIIGKKPKMKWIMDYALPISMIIGMACAIPLTIWLG